MRAPNGRFLLAALVVATSARAEPTTSDKLGTEQHEAQVERVRSALDAEFRRVLTDYDRLSARRPDDEALAIERCKFIDAIGDVELISYETVELEARKCLKGLQARFPESPESLLFGFERAWGPDARVQGEALLARTTWNSVARARVHAHLSRVETMLDDPLRAGAHAISAVELDPESPMRIDAARRLVDIGAPDRALTLLRGINTEKTPPYALSGAAELLLGLGDHDGALGLVRAAERPAADADSDDAPFAGQRSTRLTILLARALAAAGRPDDARALLQPLEGREGPHAIDGRRGRFELELAHGSSEQIEAAYRDLRALGYDVDALGRDRLRVLMRAPGAAWHAEDALALSFLVAFVIGLSLLLPLIVIVPVHHRGVVLELRGARPDAAHRYSLRRAWLALAGVVGAGTVSFFVFAYPELVAIVGIDRLGSIDDVANEADLAAAFALQSICMLAVVVPLGLHGQNVRALLLGTWSIKRSIMFALGAAFVLRVLAIAYTALLNALLGEGDTADVGAIIAAADPLTTSTLRAMTGIYVHYGFGALVLVAVIVVPFVEELAFRGIVLHAFAGRIGFVVAALVQASMFAAVHEDLSVAPLYVLFGIVAALLVRRGGGLLPAFIMHAAFNVTAAFAIAMLSRAANG